MQEQKIYGRREGSVGHLVFDAGIERFGRGPAIICSAIDRFAALPDALSSAEL